MQQDPTPLLEIRGLTTRFQTQNGNLNAADDVSLTVGRAETVGIVGESGCGKSVTSLSVLRLVPSPGRIVSGSVFFEGEDLIARTGRQMEEIRGRDISMIFQEPMTSLNPVYTVGRQVAEALLVHNRGSGHGGGSGQDGNAGGASTGRRADHSGGVARGARRKAARKKVIELFGHVGISEPEARFDAYPHQLSGGLRQRAMIAMALICRPKLIIADEPTTALDVTIEAQILRLMKKLQEETGTSILLISHNLGVIAETCDRVYVMYAGRIVEEADVFDLFGRTFHPYTSGLLASIPRKNGDVEPGKPLRSIPGGVPDMTRLPSGCKFAPRCGDFMDICGRKEPELADCGSGHKVRCWKYIDREGA